MIKSARASASGEAGEDRVPAGSGFPSQTPSPPHTRASRHPHGAAGDPGAAWRGLPRVALSIQQTALGTARRPRSVLTARAPCSGSPLWAPHVRPPVSPREPELCCPSASGQVVQPTTEAPGVPREPRGPGSVLAPAPRSRRLSGSEPRGPGAIGCPRPGRRVRVPFLPPCVLGGGTPRVQAPPACSPPTPTACRLLFSFRTARQGVSHDPV